MLAAVALSAACAGPYDPQAAQALWASECARCHGDDGRGDARFEVLSPRVDLRLSENLARGPIAGKTVRRTIADGGETMPGFAHRLADPEIDLLTAYSFELVREDQTPAR